MEWHLAGKVRQGLVFENMKNSRKNFKNALKFCKNNEMKIRKENLLRKFKTRNKKAFWKEISKLKGKKVKKFVQIDGKSKPEVITGIFDNSYRQILNDPSSQTVCSHGHHFHYPEFEPPILSYEILDSALMELNIGLGWDGIHANHLKFSGMVFRNLFLKFLNIILNHSYVPQRMAYGEIRPVIKNNALNKQDSENYRPVMNSSVLLKTFEYCLLPFLKKHLKINRLQFGFRENTGCLSAVALLKETIFKYHDENTNVHCATVDMSKAFDRLNHSLLFKKLSETSLNPMIIAALRSMYNNTNVNTSFNSCRSSAWKVGNGVRQGGILSPILFSFYINEVLEHVSNMNVGCSINGYKTNILGYADDIVVLAPSAIGIQMLLDTLNEKLTELCLKFNRGKSSYLMFNMKRSQPLNLPTMWLDNCELKKVNSIKYLGVYLSGNGDMGMDIDRVITCFLKQFNSLYSKFHCIDRRVLAYLFKSYTSSFYGIDLWFDKIYDYQLNKISVAYHKAIKRICGMNVWDSNHDACERMGVNTFTHLLVKRLIKFWHRLIKSESDCLCNLKLYFQFKSQIAQKLKALVMASYEVDLFTNPLCAILARIDFVQRNEPRSTYGVTRQEANESNPD